VNDLYDEYLKRGGDPKELVNLVVKTKKDMSMGQKQRDQGIPTNSLPSIKRYKDFQEE
jgi:hypothetical protein